MRTARWRAERMAAMRRSLQMPLTSRPRIAELGLTAAGVALGLLTLALQESADDATWRHVDALAVLLGRLMPLPGGRCRPAPAAPAVIAIAAALIAAALGYPPTSGWFSALLIGAAAVYLTDRRHAIALTTFTL